MNAKYLIRVDDICENLNIKNFKYVCIDHVINYLITKKFKDYVNNHQYV